MLPTKIIHLLSGMFLIATATRLEQQQPPDIEGAISYITEQSARL